MDFLLSMGSNCLENDIVEGEAEKEAENDPIFPIEAEDTDSLKVFLNFPDFNQEDEVLNIPEDLEAETETPQSRPKKRRMQSRNPVRNGRTLCPVDNKGFTRASNSLTCKDCYTKFHVKCIRFQYSEEDFLCEECQSVLSPDTGYDGSPSPVTPAGSRPSLERYLAVPSPDHLQESETSSGSPTDVFLASSSYYTGSIFTTDESLPDPEDYWNSDLLSTPVYTCVDLRPSRNIVTAKRTVVAPEPEDPFAVCHYCKKGILLARHKNTSCKCGEKFHVGCLR